LRLNNSILARMKVQKSLITGDIASISEHQMAENIKLLSRHILLFRNSSGHTIFFDMYSRKILLLSFNNYVKFGILIKEFC